MVTMTFVYSILFSFSLPCNIFQHNTMSDWLLFYTVLGYGYGIVGTFKDGTTWFRNKGEH